MMEKNLEGHQERKSLWELFFILVLLIYPLRHINIGLDLWDTGYSYANFLYMGTDHMDPMWLFSTYLANVIGHMMTLLPFGKTLIGMNFYTGLCAGVLALLGYYFCTRSLQLPKAVVFLGEFVALSLCWCPTAVLYNYVTYIFYLLGVIFLYKGLTTRENKNLFLAGICLGLNVFVRFSNLAEAAMIVGVWAYGVIEGLEWRKSAEGAEKKKWLGAAWHPIWRNTLWCLGGYLAAIAVIFAYISLRYGAGEYLSGIARLFAMTDGATDYKPAAMVYSLFGFYIKNFYWFKRVCSFIVVAFLAYNLLRLMGRIKLFKQLPEWIRRTAKVLAVLGCACIGGFMLVWMWQNDFYSLGYYEYHSMLGPGIVFLMFTILIGVCKVLWPGVKKEEKLISGLVVLIVILTSLGSNNGVYPSLNNLFIAAPYLLWQFWKFCTEKSLLKIRKISMGLLPVKVIFGIFLFLVIGQSIGFGAHFVFQETRGAKETVAEIDNNSVLAGIRMNEERARWMEELSEYVRAQGLQGQEVILFGQIPSLSFYLQMPSSFNPWSDLSSYTYDTMVTAMDKVVEEVNGGKRAPVVIVDRMYLEQEEKLHPDKWQLIVDYMEKFDYQLSFFNEKFVIYER
ncbi:MAG: hypothetical protein IJ335_05215 [Lachnospiraceae bacterium]|nr:hypothetical protein [Lachnospiraceae bacterium]